MENKLPSSKSIVAIKKYAPEKSVRLHNDLFDITKCISRMDKVHAVKMLFALAQAVQGNDLEHFPQIIFPIDIAFEYLGIKASNKRFEYLKETLDTILDNSLKIVEYDNYGNPIAWKGISWVSSYYFGKASREVVIDMNPMAEKYLLQLSQYASIKPKSYVALTTAYQCWLYPYLKNVYKLGVWEVSIADLKKLLSAEDKSSYTDLETGTNKFLKRVIGITISSKAKEENKLSKKERRKPKYVPWDFTKDSKGNYTGSLYHINSKTELKVSACAIKTGRLYTRVVFLFGEASEYFEQEPQEKTLFNDFLESVEKPMKKRKKIEISESEVARMAQEFHLTIEQLLMKSKESIIYENGKYYRYEYHSYPNGG